MEFEEMLDIRLRRIENTLSNSEKPDLSVEHVESDIFQNESTVRIQIPPQTLFPELSNVHENVRIEEIKVSIKFDDDVDFRNADLKEC